MSDLEQLKLVIQESSDLSKRGQDEEALALLDEALVRAVHENRIVWIRVLSRHAAVISDSMGDTHRVRQYYEQLLTADPANSAALYGLAKALHSQGETELAKQYASRCYKLIRQSESELDQGLVELIVATWPQFNRSS